MLNAKAVSPGCPFGPRARADQPTLLTVSNGHHPGYESIRCLHITNALDARYEIREADVDATSAGRIGRRPCTLTSRWRGSILEQQSSETRDVMRRRGWDCRQGGIDCSAKRVSVVLMGTHGQMETACPADGQYADHISIAKKPSADA